MLRSTLKIALNLVFFSISAISYAQDASFQSDESYITGDELQAISGVGVYQANNPFRPLKNGSTAPPHWEFDTPSYQSMPSPCIRLSDNLVMPVTGEIRADITLVAPSGTIKTGTNPTFFVFELAGRDPSGNEQKVAVLPLTPLEYGFEIIKVNAEYHKGYDSAYFGSLLNLSFSGNNSAPLTDVHLRACGFTRLPSNAPGTYTTPRLSIQKINIFLRRSL